MDVRVNEARTFKYLNPAEILTDPEALKRAIDEHGTGLSLNDRRKLVEETTQAAAWCAGMSQLWKRRVTFSPGERLGVDSVLKIEREGESTIIGHLQLTQLPDESRSTIGLEHLIGKKVQKVNDPESLYLAVAVNRSGEIDFDALNLPPGLEDRVLELWIFGRYADDPAMWFFRGYYIEGGPGIWRLRIEDRLADTDVRDAGDSRLPQRD